MRIFVISHVFYKVMLKYTLINNLEIFNLKSKILSHFLHMSVNK